MAFLRNQKAIREIKENGRIQTKIQHSELWWSSDILMALTIAAICVELNCQADMETSSEGSTLLKKLSISRVRYHWKWKLCVNTSIFAKPSNSLPWFMCFTLIDIVHFPYFSCIFSWEKPTTKTMAPWLAAESLCAVAGFAPRWPARSQIWLKTSSLQ